MKGLVLEGGLLCSEAVALRGFRLTPAACSTLQNLLAELRLTTLFMIPYGCFLDLIVRHMSSILPGFSRKCEARNGQGLNEQSTIEPIFYPFCLFPSEHTLNIQ